MAKSQAVQLIQIADDPGDIRTANKLKLIAHDGEQIPSLTYLITRTADGTYFSQVMAPRLSLNMSARAEFDPASLSGSLKVLDGDYAPAAIWRAAQYYQSEMLAVEVDSSISAPTTRPGVGAVHEKALAEEIRRFTGLPDNGRSIGAISGVTDRNGRQVDISINEQILRHHMGVGGTTGYGKTNVLSNVVEAGVDAGFAVIINDLKPDYVRADEPNPYVPDGRGLKNVTFWTLGPMERADAIPIKVPARELSPELLANVMFWRNGEDLQAEAFATIFSGFATIMRDDGIIEWSWDDFIEWLDKFNGPEDLGKALPTRVKLNERTLGAVRWKIKAPGRLPGWVERSDDFDPLGDVPPDFFEALVAGSVHVVRVDGGVGGRSYALFLDYSLTKIADYRNKREIAKVLNIIDEASDIFSAKNGDLRNQAVACLSEHIRKGRSRGIGFVISVQSAGDIPPEIRNNLNSVIALRHKNPSVLKEILPEQANEIFGIVNNLQRGEALVHLFGVRGLIHATMKQSRFKLYDPDAEDDLDEQESEGA